MSKKSDKLLADLLNDSEVKVKDPKVSVYNKSMETKQEVKQQEKPEVKKEVIESMEFRALDTMATMIAANVRVIMNDNVNARISDKTFEDCVAMNLKVLAEFIKDKNEK